MAPANRSEQIAAFRRLTGLLLVIDALAIASSKSCPGVRRETSIEVYGARQSILTPRAFTAAPASAAAASDGATL